MQLLHTLFIFMPLLVLAAQHSHISVREDLSSVLNSRPASNTEVFSAAIRIVQSLQSSSTCNHMAALSLVNSCRSLKTDSKTHQKESEDAEPILDEIKSEYAARLAICELAGANVPHPPQCAGLVASHQGCKKFRLSEILRWGGKGELPDQLCYPEITENEFRDCLRILESRPQWWTSYSNARQNAVLLCQASRDAIETSQRVSVLRSLTEVASAVTSALGQSLHEAQIALDKQKIWNAELLAEQQNIRSATLRDQRDARDFNKAIYSELSKSLRGVFDKFSQNWQILENEIGPVQRNLKQVMTDTQEARQSVVELVADIHDLGLKQLARNNQHWTDHIEQIGALQRSLAETNDVLVLSVGKAIASVEEHATNSLKQLSTLDERLQTLDETVDATSKKSLEIFSFLSPFYATFSHGRNILTIVLALVLLASNKAVHFIFGKWGRRVLCMGLLVLINWPASLALYHFILGNLQVTTIALAAVCCSSILLSLVYHILHRQAIKNEEGFGLPKIEAIY